MKRGRILVAATSWIMVVATIYAAGCSGTGTSTSPNTSASSTSPTGPTTAGQLADAGKVVFASRCAKCHGASGQGITGPVLVGTTNTLDKYGTAQGLLDFIDRAMPLDAPASLSSQEYLQVVSFLLVQNNFISASSTLDASQLSSVALK